MSKIRYITVFIILAFSVFAAEGKDSLYYESPTHRVTVEAKPAYNMATHGIYNGYNAAGKKIKTGTSFHLKYSFESPDNSTNGKRYPGSYQGIGAAVNTFYSHKITGTPVSLYIFQGMRLAGLSSSLTIGYEWNLGLSTWWERNEAVGSRNNIYINAGIPFIWRITPEWEFSFGPEYTHFSNGDTCYPNGGANTIGFRLGVSKVCNSSANETAGRHLFSGEEELICRPVKDRMLYDLMVYGGWRAKRTLSDMSLCIINKPFGLAGTSINPLYKCNRYFRFGPALDITYDSSANIEDIVFDKETGTVSSWSRPELWKQVAAGVSIRGELNSAYFAINLGVGYNILKSGKDMKGLYTVYNLKVRLTDLAYLNIGYRLSSLNYTHNLMFGIGFRL